MSRIAQIQQPVLPPIGPPKPEYYPAELLYVAVFILQIILIAIIFLGNY